MGSGFQRQHRGTGSSVSFKRAAKLGVENRYDLHNFKLTNTNTLMNKIYRNLYYRIKSGYISTKDDMKVYGVNQHVRDCGGGLDSPLSPTWMGRTRLG